MIAGLPNGTLFPILDQAARYFGWLAVQGYLATIHPWIAIIAADRGRCAPPRGAGRLLWMCEHMAGPTAANDLVPQLWKSRDQLRSHRTRLATRQPTRHCQLTPADYAALLRGTTGIELSITGSHVHATNPITGALTV